MNFRVDRRDFLKVGAAATTFISLPSVLRGQSDVATLSLEADARPVTMAPTFTGLSYESSQLSHPGYFSAGNKGLVRMLRSLGTQGVLRIGGNTSDYDDWTPEKMARTDPGYAGAAGPDTGLDISHHTKVTQTAIDELRTFLDATGWKLIYGIDLGHGTPESAADEAAYVVNVIGPALMALQIGNEADLFYRNTIRKPEYGYSDFIAEWKRFAEAIRRRTPNAPLAGPDVANRYEWVDQFAAEAADVRLLTSHYYAEGPPTSPASDIPHLLNPHPLLVEHMQHAVEVAKQHGLSYRMAEGNSCYHGGKEGVSDAFAAALWGADFMMLLSQLGVVGVNFHGGGHGFYAPITGGDPTTPLQARPLFYGMVFFREFQGKSITPCKLNTSGVNATAYVSRDETSKTKLALINKDLGKDLRVMLDAKEFHKPLRQFTMTAPSADSKTGVLLGGKSVSASQVFSAEWSTPSNYKNGEVVVPKTSALLLEFA